MIPLYVVLILSCFVMGLTKTYDGYSGEASMWYIATLLCFIGGSIVECLIRIEKVVRRLPQAFEHAVTAQQKVKEALHPAITELTDAARKARDESNAVIRNMNKY